jgi:pimeloyl-ACP methyl ester carboxylesterase
MPAARAAQPAPAGTSRYPPEYEKEIHDLVPGSRYVQLSGAGHFPPTEIPDTVNALIEEFVATP